MPHKKKPRMGPDSYALLRAVDEHIRRYPECPQADIPDAASDALDGAVTRTEIDELVRRRLLTVVHHNDDEYAHSDLCGTSWTVRLTPHAVDFWRGESK